MRSSSYHVELRCTSYKIKQRVINGHIPKRRLTSKRTSGRQEWTRGVGCSHNHIFSKCVAIGSGWKNKEIIWDLTLLLLWVLNSHCLGTLPIGGCRCCTLITTTTATIRPFDASTHAGQGNRIFFVCQGETRHGCCSDRALTSCTSCMYTLSMRTTAAIETQV